MPQNSSTWICTRSSEAERRPVKAIVGISKFPGYAKSLSYSGKYAGLSRRKRAFDSL